MSRDYDLLCNDRGELLLVIGRGAGEPRSPRVVCDAAGRAVFYRSADEALRLEGLGPRAARALREVSELRVSEIDAAGSAREYTARVRQVEDLSVLNRKL